jgi:hypothetical protein
VVAPARLPSLFGQFFHQLVATDSPAAAIPDDHGKLPAQGAFHNFHHTIFTGPKKGTPAIKRLPRSGNHKEKVQEISKEKEREKCGHGRIRRLQKTCRSSSERVNSQSR